MTTPRDPLLEPQVNNFKRQIIFILPEKLLDSLEVSWDLLAGTFSLIFREKDRVKQKILHDFLDSIFETIPEVELQNNPNSAEITISMDLLDLNEMMISLAQNQKEKKQELEECYDTVFSIHEKQVIIESCEQNCSSLLRSSLNNPSIPEVYSKIKASLARRYADLGLKFKTLNKSDLQKEADAILDFLTKQIEMAKNAQSVDEAVVVHPKTSNKRVSFSDQDCIKLFKNPEKKYQQEYKVVCKLYVDKKTIFNQKLANFQLPADYRKECILINMLGLKALDLALTKKDIAHWKSQLTYWEAIIKPMDGMTSEITYQEVCQLHVDCEAELMKKLEEEEDLIAGIQPSSIRAPR
jgi:hypothetical protein